MDFVYLEKDCATSEFPVLYLLISGIPIWSLSEEVQVADYKIQQ